MFEHLEKCNLTTYGSFKSTFKIYYNVCLWVITYKSFKEVIAGKLKLDFKKQNWNKNGSITICINNFCFSVLFVFY